MPKFNIGFGDPADPKAETGLVALGTDAENGGFGSQPSNLGSQEQPLGFGDKDPPPIQSPVLVGAVDGHVVLHDEGGEVVKIYASFAKDANLDGYTEYRVRLKGPNEHTTFYPSSGSCYGSIAGAGQKLKPTAANTILEFAMPACPLGAYVVCIYGADDLNTPIWQIEDMILVDRRKRDKATYRTRDRLHQLFLTGPRNLGQESDYPA